MRTFVSGQQCKAVLPRYTSASSLEGPARQITIRLDDATIEYFKELADETDISYQNLMNFYLCECASERRKPLTKWVKQAEQKAGFDARIRSRKSA